MTSFDTQHADMIHDVQMDYYGKRMATCSSDRTVKIFSQARAGEKPVLQTELKGHEGAVWQVCWAHPRFGSLLASCGYDRKVIVWKEEDGQWRNVYEYKVHELSVNSVAWAPHEYGLILACGSSDGRISVHTYDRGQWAVDSWPAHQVGVNAVSWGPAVWETKSGGGNVPTLLGSGNATSSLSRKRLVSGGCDNMVRVWGCDLNTGKWELESELSRHKGWVRDVSWAPNVGLPSNTIASCSQDGSVVIWTKEGSSNWSYVELPRVSKDVVWRVSWSIAGNILAVSAGNNKVTLWKESLDKKGDWKIISQMDENGNLQHAG